MLIYFLYCPQSKKGYVGQTTQSLERRWTQHCSDAKRGSDYPLHNAIRKYGTAAFDVSILNTTDNLDELNKLEIEQIAKKNTLKPNGYNLTLGGKNHIFTEETKTKMSMAAKNKPSMLEETKRKLSNSLIGNKYTAGHVLTEDHKTKISIALTGRVFSEETKTKMSLGQKGNQKWLGRKHSPETIEKCRIARLNWWKERKK